MWFSIISSIIFLAIATILFTPELRTFPIYRSLSFFFLFEALFIVINFIITETWSNITNLSTVHNIGCIIFGTYVLISISKYMQNIKQTNEKSPKKETNISDSSTDKKINTIEPTVTTDDSSKELTEKKEPTKKTTTGKSSTTSTRKRTRTTTSAKTKTTGTSTNSGTKKKSTNTTKPKTTTTKSSSTSTKKSSTTSTTNRSKKSSTSTDTNTAV